MSKIRMMAAIAAVAALGLTACSANNAETQASGTSGNSTSESGGVSKADGSSLVVWTDAERAPVLRELGEKFKNETGVALEIVQKNFEDLRSDFIAQVPTGEGPDITVGAHDWLGAFVSAGVVDTVDLGESAAEIQDVALDAFTYDGQVYGLPYAVEAIALIQNVDLVGEDAPATWDEMLQMAQDAGVERPIAMYTNGESGDGYTMYPLQMSFGAPVFSQLEDGSYTAEIGMGGENGIKFAQWLYDNGQAGNKSISTTVDYDTGNELMTSGQSAFIIQGPWVVSLYQDAGLNIAVHPVPTAGGAESSPFVGVQGFYVSSQAKNPLLANEFLMKYIGTYEGQKALYEAEPRIPAWESLAEEVTDDSVTSGFLASAKNGVPMPSIPEMGTVWDFWNAAEAQIINGAEPEKTWTDMISNLENSLGN